MSNVKDRLLKESRVFLRPSGSHSVQPEQLHDENKVAGFCRQETVTSLKAKKIVANLLQVDTNKKAMQESNAPSASKLVKNHEQLRETYKNHLSKLAHHRKWNPGKSVRDNHAIKPIQENYEQQSRDRQFVANERKKSEERRQDQLHFSDGDESIIIRRAPSNDRAKSKKTKHQRSVSEETHEENKRRKISVPNKKARDDNSEKNDDLLERRIADLDKKANAIQAERHKLEAARKKREKTRRRTEENRRAAEKKQREQKKKEERKRHSSDREKQLIVQKKSAEIRAKLRDKTTISAEEKKRKEQLEALKMARRKSRQSIQDDESSSDEEQPQRQNTRPTSPPLSQPDSSSEDEQVAQPAEPPPQKSDSSSEDEQPMEKVSRLRNAPCQQSESSSESEESEQEEVREANNVSDNNPHEEEEILSEESEEEEVSKTNNVSNIKPASPEDKKPKLVTLFANMQKSRIPTLIDDERHDDLARQLMRITGGVSPTQLSVGQADGVQDVVAPVASTSAVVNPAVKKFEVVDLDEESDIEDSAKEMVSKDEKNLSNIEPEAKNNPDVDEEKTEDEKAEAIKTARSFEMQFKMEPVEMLNHLNKKFNDYLKLEEERSLKIMKKFRAATLKIDENLGGKKRSLRAYKVSMLEAHLEDNINNKPRN